MDLSALQKHKTGLLTIAGIAVVAALVLSSFDGDENMVPPTQESVVEANAEVDMAPTSAAKPSAPATSAPQRTYINGSTYGLTSYNGYVIPESAEYTISFKAGNATFEDGFIEAKFCNTLSSPYRNKSGVVSADLTGPKKYCDDAKLREMEGALVVLLGGGAPTTISGNRLTLSDNIRTFEFVKQ